MKRFLPLLLIPAALLVSQPKSTTTVPNSQLRGPFGNQLAQSVTVVVVGTPNSFALPAGKTVCIVSRNIPQAPGVDYTITGGAVVFVTPPEIGDVVQLNCF